MVFIEHFICGLGLLSEIADGKNDFIIALALVSIS